MYSEGTIIYFTPFYFKDGTPSKPKYFIVLKSLSSSLVLVSLPTSQQYLPQQIPVSHGCLEIPEQCINCYIIKAQQVITTNNWSFELDTFLYGQWLDEYSVEILSDIYAIEGIDYHIIGKLTDTEYRKIIQCFSGSSSVKRKYKRILS